MTFAKHLAHAQSGLTPSRYLRLIAMSVVLMFISAVSTSITLWYSTLSLRAWTSFADVHWGFPAIDLYTTFGTPVEALTYYYVIWLFVPVSSFVFFAFFAFGRDAVNEHRDCMFWGRRGVLRRRETNLKPVADFVSIPSARWTVLLSARSCSLLSRIFGQNICEPFLTVPDLIE